MPLLAELQRRNVIRVAMAYLALAWLVVQVLDTLSPIFGISDGAARIMGIMSTSGGIGNIELSTNATIARTHNARGWSAIEMVQS